MSKVVINSCTQFNYLFVVYLLIVYIVPQGVENTGNGPLNTDLQGEGYIYTQFQLYKVEFHISWLQNRTKR